MNYSKLLQKLYNKLKKEKGYETYNMFGKKPYQKLYPYEKSRYLTRLLRIIKLVEIHHSNMIFGTEIKSK